MILVNDYVVEKGYFPDGTMNVKNEFFIDLFKNSNEFTFTWIWEDESETVLLYYLVSHVREHCKRNSGFYLNMPYIPNARLDRTDNKLTDVFTLKYFCKFINSLKFDRVYVMDAHSNVSLALIDNVESIGIITLIRSVYNTFKPDIFFFPDEGSYKRYAKYIKENLFEEGNKTEVPCVFANKQRTQSNGRIESLSIVNPEQVNGKRVLIVDDICSYGGTFLRSAKALKDAGAKEIALYVTHCENSIVDGDFIKSGLVEKIYTTNTILKKEHPLIEKVSHYKIP
jgi:ribose-phosphate pyrophosphokinase